jgi:GMP synthase (glutamine-hydrolysing)
MPHTKTVLVVEHAPRRANGILRHLGPSAAFGLNHHVWRCYEQSMPPEVRFDALILSGGPMMVDALRQGTYEFFRAERTLIETAERNELPILGVCLGAQVLADVFGGVVTPGEWAVGWHTVRMTRAALRDSLFATTAGFMTFELHRDYITMLPPEAIELAISDNSHNEAFRLKENSRTWGCVFHPEIDSDEAQRIFDINPNMFLAHGVQRSQLEPSSDGAVARRKLFENFARIIIDE